MLAIICNWNKQAFLRGLLTSLRQLGGTPFDILVVDNASTDGSPQMVREEFPEANLHETGANLGGTGGFNAGMSWGLRSNTNYDFFWLLDNDVEVHPHALDALLDAINEDAKIALAGSAVLLLNNAEHVQEMGAVVNWETGDLERAGEGPLANLDRPKTFKVDYCAACSLLARVEAIREVGIWDPGYFVYWDDIDWGVRMRRAGWRVVSTTESQVRHESFDNRRPTSGSAMDYLRYRNAYYFYWRFAPRGRRFSLLYSQFRTNLAFADSFELDGDHVGAKAMRRAITDVLHNNMGAPPWEEFKKATKQTEEKPQAAPAKLKRIALMLRDNPELGHKIHAHLAKEYGEAEIETLIFTRSREMQRENFPRSRFLNMDTFPRRLALAFSLPFRYDAIVAPAFLPRFLFEKFVAWNIRVGEDMSFETRRRSLREIIRLAFRRQMITLQAAYYALRLAFKKPPEIDYHHWRE